MTPGIGQQFTRRMVMLMTAHEAMHSSDGFRFYCLEPWKRTPSITTKLTSKKAKTAIKKALRAGFGANSAKALCYPNNGSECEYATQLAIWDAAGLISKIDFKNETAHKIYNHIEKRMKQAKYSDSGTTTLKIKATNVDKDNGLATIEADVTENRAKRNVNFSIEANNIVKDDSSGGALADANGKIKANTAYDISLKDKNLPGSIKVKTPKYILTIPFHNAASKNEQDTVALLVLNPER